MNTTRVCAVVNRLLDATRAHPHTDICTPGIEHKPALLGVERCHAIEPITGVACYRKRTHSAAEQHAYSEEGFGVSWP